jgi:hypothetical protein
MLKGSRRKTRSLQLAKDIWGPGTCRTGGICIERQTDIRDQNVFFSFCQIYDVAPKWRSSKGRFSQIWLQDQYESKCFKNIILPRGLKNNNCDVVEVGVIHKMI